MPLTYDIFTAGAGQTDFAVAFPYIDVSHIKCSIDGAGTTAFSVNTSSNVLTLNVAAAGGEKVRVFRQTPGRATGDADLIVDFQDGSVLTESDLDTSQKQLLYLAQEAQETGQAALPVDAFGNYDANFKRITNLGSANDDNDAVRKSYVDSLALYGQAASDPQTWTILGNEFTGNTGDITYVMGDPEPFSTNDNLFIVALDGYLQRPGVDFTVTELLGVYTLTLKMGTVTIGSDAIVTVQNFGVSRNVYEQPFIMANQTSPALTAKGVTGATAPVLDVENETGTTVASVNLAGDITSATLSVSGNATVGGNAAVTGSITSSTLTATTINATDLNVTDDLTVTDDVTIGGDVAVTGSLNTSGGIVSGNSITSTGGAIINATGIDGSRGRFYKTTGQVKFAADDPSGYQFYTNSNTLLMRMYTSGQMRIFRSTDTSDYIQLAPDNAGSNSVMLGVREGGTAKAYFTGNGRILKTGAQDGNQDVLNRSELDDRFFQLSNKTTTGIGINGQGTNITALLAAISALNSNKTYLYIILGGGATYDISRFLGFGMSTPGSFSYSNIQVSYYFYKFIELD